MTYIIIVFLLKTSWYYETVLIINAQRACARGIITVIIPCVSVCSSFTERLYNILNMATGFTLYLQTHGFLREGSFKSSNCDSL